MYIKTKLISFVLICTFVFTSCSLTNTPEQKLDLHLKKLTNHANSFSISVLIADHGKILYKKSFGYADVEKKIPATPNTNYHIGSITKMFTAMCIIQLKERGYFNYETPIHTILKDFPQYGNEITIRHLLTHTSGLKDYYGDPTKLIGGGFSETNQLTDSDVYEIVKRMDSTYFSPGTNCQYSDTNYVILGQIVEAASGLSLSEFMSENIFRPLNMSQTIAYDPNTNQTIPNRAMGADLKGRKYVTSDQSYSSAVLGDGGIYSSLEDLYKWDQALDKGTLVSKEVLKEAYQIPSFYPVSSSATYRCGWHIYDNHKEITEQNYCGGTQGFASYYLKQPPLGKTFIVLCNHTYDDDIYMLHFTVRKLYDFKPEHD